MDLLSILFKFTFSQNNTEAFLACLEIWDEFLDQLMVLEWSQFLGGRPSVTYQDWLRQPVCKKLANGQVFLLLSSKYRQVT